MKYLSILLIGLLVFTGCRDDEFDGPPTDFVNPDIEVNTTIAELKASNILGEFDEITDDIIISGIVTADDESGNFFSELIIQDESGAISLALDANDLYNQYPVGRRLFVNLKGLWIGDNRGAQQIGAGTQLNGTFINVARIPEALIGQYITAGAVEGQPEPIVKSLSQLTTADYNTLIRLKEVEIAPNLVGQPYAIAGGGGGQNQTVVDCDGNDVVLRNSDFATFAGEPMPDGNGDIVCIYSVYDSDPQLKIRSTDDMILQNASCNTSSSDCSEVTIAAFRDCYSGTETPAPAGQLVGTVISDRDGNNINSQNLVLQDGNRGIVIRFTDAHSFSLGDALSINTAGGLIGDFNGLLQVSELAPSAASVTSTGNMVTPNIVSVDNILSNGDNLESTLVQINNVGLTGSTWGDGVDVSDGTGSINVFTFFTSTFGDDTVPATAESLVAIVSRFNDFQLNLRNGSDINGGGTVNPGNPVEVSIQSIRDLWTGTGSSANVGADQKIAGVVISDFANGNITDRNLVIQNGDAGIVVRFNEPHSFGLGDNIEVIVSGQEVSDFNDLVQLNNVPNANATSTSAGLVITPAEVGIDEVKSNIGNYESRLVKFNGVTISGATTFNGGTVVSDGSNDIDMFTRGDATFSGDAVPGGTVNLTGIIGNFNGVQVNMRNASDVE